MVGHLQILRLVEIPEAGALTFENVRRGLSQSRVPTIGGDYQSGRISGENLDKHSSVGEI